jgi:hypothetical protein
LVVPALGRFVGRGFRGRDDDPFKTLLTNHLDDPLRRDLSGVVAEGDEVRRNVAIFEQRNPRKP